MIERAIGGQMVVKEKATVLHPKRHLSILIKNVLNFIDV